MSDQNVKRMSQIIFIILRTRMKLDLLSLRMIRIIIRMMKSLEIPCLYHTMWLFPKKLLMMVCHFSVLIVKTCQLIIWIHKITRWVSKIFKNVQYYCVFMKTKRFVLFLHKNEKINQSELQKWSPFFKQNIYL